MFAEKLIRYKRKIPNSSNSKQIPILRSGSQRSACSIAKLHQAAAELNEQSEIEKMIAQAIGYSLEAPQESTPEPQPEEVRETYEEIVERVLQIQR
jgi:hypothetical protein